METLFIIIQIICSIISINKVQMIRGVQNEAKEIAVVWKSQTIEQKTLNEATKKLQSLQIKNIYEKSFKEKNMLDISAAENKFTEIKETIMEQTCKNLPGYCGRLYIPSQNINVALYNSNAQSVCDRIDSACYYASSQTHIVADHNNQSFKTLSSVCVGDKAYIIWADDSRTDYTCTTCYDGINTGQGLANKDGSCAENAAAFLAYTCMENWTHVWICKFS